MSFTGSRLLEHVKLPRYFTHCYLQQTMRRFSWHFITALLRFSLVATYF